MSAPTRPRVAPPHGPVRSPRATFRTALRTREVALSGLPVRRPVLTGLTFAVVALALCGLCSLWVDVPVARFVAAKAAGLRNTAQVLTHVGQSGYMLVFALAAFSLALHLRRLGWAGRAELSLLAERAFYVFAAVALASLLAVTLKYSLGRARPRYLDEFGAYHFDLFSLKASLASFPSGHSASIFALATALGLLLPRLHMPIFALGVLVAGSRVLLGAHFVSDVLAGATLGVLVPFAVAMLLAGRQIAFLRKDGQLLVKGAGTVAPALATGWTKMRLRR